MLVLVALLLAWMPSGHAETRHVLLLNSHEGLPTTERLNNGIERALASAPDRIEVFSESLDVARFPEPRHERLIKEFLQARYGATEIDVVITAGREALLFVVNYGSELFPNAATVFTGIRDSSVSIAAGLPNATGIVNRLDPAKTLELALALQPAPDRIVVVSGAGVIDQGWRSIFREQARIYDGQFEIDYLGDKPLEATLEELRRLPRDAIVIYTSILEDGSGKYFAPGDLTELLSSASSAPLYGVYETYVGNGIVGGYVDMFTRVGEEAGGVALRILSGDSAANIPWRLTEQSRYVVDWRQLRRWGLDEARLPSGTIVQYEDPSVWEKYRAQILGVAALLALQTLLIVSLWLRSRKLRAERALEQSQELYRNVVESQTALICRYLPDTTLTFVNEAYSVYFGRTREELIGSHVTAHILARDRDRFVAKVRALLTQPNPETFAYQVIKADGTVGWQQWNAHAIFDESGRAVEIQGIGQDITRLHLAQDELRQSREQVTHLTRVGILGQLSGALAHELNQPLTAMLSNAQVAQRLLEKPNPDLLEMREILKDIVADDIRAGEVIARLRNLLKNNSAEFELLDLTQLTMETLALVRGQLIERHVTVSTRLAQNLPLTHGDRVQLQQVLLNLLLNAADAMNANELNDRQLTLSTMSGKDGFLRCEVADIGSGITPAAFERLFEPFFTTKTMGLGLGLSICQTIVTAHGGSLTAGNNPDRGARFSFTLPRACQAEEADGSSEAAVQETGATAVCELAPAPCSPVATRAQMNLPADHQRRQKL